MPTPSPTASIAFVLACLAAACGGGGTPPPTPPPGGSAAPSAAPSAGASAGPATPPPPLVDHVKEDKVAEALGPDNLKLISVSKLSQKTGTSLVKNQLFVAVNECPNAKLVEVAKAPGLLVPAPLKVRERTYQKLVAAGARAQQRGTALEVLKTQVSVKDAVAEWNRAVIDAALKLVKAAKPADLKDKSFATEAMKAVGEENSPKTFDQTACESGRLGGAVVEVQLVTVDASNNRGKVLVKGGADAEHFVKDTYEQVYWDKAKGKQFRTLTEIMSVGFFRQCSSSSVFGTSTIEDGTWRCKDANGDSWDPSNRPIPPWQ
jgi:hypothetical protein